MTILQFWPQWHTFLAREIDVALPDRADLSAAQRGRTGWQLGDRAHGEGGHLRRLRVHGPDGTESELDADACFVFIGASPRTDWLDGVVARDARGFILAGLMPRPPAGR